MTTQNKARTGFRPFQRPINNEPVDISEPPQQQTAQPQQNRFAQRTTASVQQPIINFPEDMETMFISTTPQQRLGVLLGLANGIIQEKGQGNKYVNIYVIIKSMRDIFGEIPVELGMVQDCIDTMIYKGIVRKFGNPEAYTSDGQKFYAVHYGISQAGWLMLQDYNVEAPVWRVRGSEFNPGNNPYAAQQTPYNGGRGATQRNMNGERKNQVVSL